MDKSFLDIAGFTPLLNRFLRQKSSLRFGEKCKKGGSIRKPISGFTVFKGSGRQYCMQSIPLAVLKRHDSRKMRDTVLDCMQSIPLAVLKHDDIVLVDQFFHLNCMQSIPLAVLKLKMRKDYAFHQQLHAIHTACGIETWHSPKSYFHFLHCMQSIPLAVLKLIAHNSHNVFTLIACNPYRLRY